MKLTFTEQVTLQKNDMVMTYRGRDGLGCEFFAYVRCKKDGYAQMHDDYESKTPRNIEEYGEVLYKDFLKDPDEKARQFLEKYIAENS